MNNELNIFKGGYMPWYPCNWWKNICYFFRTIKWGWQRATRGYSDYDTIRLSFPKKFCAGITKTHLNVDIMVERCRLAFQ